MKNKSLVQAFLEKGPLLFIALIIFILVVSGLIGYLVFGRHKTTNSKIKLDGHTSPVPANPEFGPVGR